MMNYGEAVKLAESGHTFEVGWEAVVDDHLEGYDFVKKYGKQVPQDCMMGVTFGRIYKGKPTIGVEAIQKPVHSKDTKVHWADIPEYISPITGKPVDGRAARREEMKRHNCREVDPSEFKPTYTNERFAKKHGLPLAQ